MGPFGVLITRIFWLIVLDSSGEVKIREGSRNPRLMTRVFLQYFLKSKLMNKKFRIFPHPQFSYMIRVIVSNFEVSATFIFNFLMRWKVSKTKILKRLCKNKHKNPTRCKSEPITLSTNSNLYVKNIRFFSHVYFEEGVEE